LEESGFTDEILGVDIGLQTQGDHRISNPLTARFVKATP
jgi:hypothetical protein